MGIFSKRYCSTLLMLVVALVVFVVVGLQTTSADTTGWLSATTSPSLQKDRDLGPSEGLPTTVAGQGNIDCTNKTVVTRPEKLPLQTELIANDCFVESAIGAYGGSGILRINGTGVAGPVTNFSGTTPTGFFAIPGSPDVIHLSSGNNGGVALRLTKQAMSKLTVNLLSTGEVRFVFNQPPDITLRDLAGNLLSAQTNSLSFSENGKWLVVDAPGKGMIRVNAETFGDVIPFAPAFNYNIGVDPGGKTAVSNDGRFVVVASRNFSVVKIYDLSTCAAVPTAITAPVSCQSRDLWSFMQSQVPGFLGAFNIRFVSNDVLEFYGLNSSPSGNKLAKYQLAAPGKQLERMQYLALGDSYISGEGAHRYKDGTDVSPNKCHLSTISYPYLIKQQLGLNSAESVACSGAVMNDITTTDGRYTGQVKDNISRSNRENVPTILGSHLPGYIAQREFVEEYKPSVITISTVGNDIGFGDKIKRCLEPDTCYESYEDRYEVMQLVRSKFEELVDMYILLKNKAAANAKIYAIGYPSVAANGGNCAANVMLNNSEIGFSNMLIGYLNYVIELATKRAGIYYVDVSDALNGNRLCEASGSAVAVNGITSGNDAPINNTGPLGKESYHPNQLGHQLLKEKILEQTNNFTATMVPADLSVKVPSINDTAPLLSAAPKTGRQIITVNYNTDLKDDVVVRGGFWGVIVDSLSTYRPLTNVTAFLRSETVQLGNFTASETGTLSAQVFLPNSVTPGFHTLHLQGVNALNEPIDIQKIVYVAASEADYDGDGVLNTEEKCLAVEPVNQDQDIDGIDDACDSQIDEPPSPPVGNFLAPTTNSNLSGITTIEVEAQDARGVQSVQFFVDGAQITEELTQHPYIHDWDTTTVNNGQHTLVARIRNNVGLETSLSQNITVYNNTPPQIRIVYPDENQTVRASIAILAETEDVEGEVSVQFKLDDNAIGELVSAPPYQINVDTKTLANGEHQISAIATDSDGLQAEISHLFNVFNPPPPTVQITNPVSGTTVTGAVQINAIAQDAEGVASVQFAVDGINIGPEITTAPYTYSWDSKTAGNGSHTITATAKSINGQTTSTSVVVYVQNQTTTTPLTWWQKLLKLFYAIIQIFR